MTFIRPEARAALWRWREVLAGAAALALGLWWIFGPGQLLALLGVAVAAGDAALVWIGVARARFRGPGDGPGTVEVDEGQVTYFGPLTGGAVALADMTELALMRGAVTTHWRLSTPTETLFIPTRAQGADRLFDAFAALPGLRTERLLAAQQDASGHDIVIWQAPSVRARTVRLH